MMQHISFSKIESALTKPHWWVLSITLVIATAIFVRFPEHVQAETSNPVHSGVVASPMGDGFADLIENVTPAVVSIKVSVAIRPEQVPSTGGWSQFPPELEQYLQPWKRSPFEPFEEYRQHRRYKELPPKSGRNPNPRRIQGGSGVIIDSSGYIVTNNHVVSDADQIVVTIHDGTEHEAKIVGTDPRTDLAVLKIEVDEALPYAAFGDSEKSRIGEWVIAVGDGLGFERSASLGILSGTKRFVPTGRLRRNAPVIPMLQFDAAINQGNSGGPLFNARGEVIGINTLIYSPVGFNVGLGFAVPSNIASDVTYKLMLDGKIEYGYLGVMIQDLDEQLAQMFKLPESSAKGALIAQVEPDGPADQAKLEVGEVIVSFDGNDVGSTKELVNMVQATSPGTQVEVVVWSNGAKRSVVLEIGNKGSNNVVPAALSDTSDFPDIGLSMTDIDDHVRQQYQLDNDVDGILVQGVVPGSIAHESGIQVGDVIQNIDNQEFTSAENVIDYLKARQREEGQVLLYLTTNEGSRFLVVDFSLN